MRDFKKIVYRYNTFHWKSLKELTNILTRKIPNQLEELRIENCKIEPSLTTALLEALNEKCYLKKLSLVNANFTVEAFNYLCDFVRESYYLEEIDLSWNHLRPSSFYVLLEILAGNQQLKYVNLSSNQLLGDAIKTEVDSPTKKKRSKKKKQQFEFD